MIDFLGLTRGLRVRFVWRVGEGEGDSLLGWGEEDAIFTVVEMGDKSGVGEVREEAIAI